MFAIFAAILPIFLLIVLGQALRRLPLFPLEFWRGLDVMGFYVLYPTLLFVTIVRADFSALSMDAIIVALGVPGIAIAVLTLALWPVLRARIALSRPVFSSVFQTAVRWNGFLAFAVAEKLFPPEGAAMVALVMAIVIIPINVESVAVVAWFAGRDPNLGGVLRKIAVNPLILATAAAIIVRSLPFAHPGPLMEMLNFLARAALGMGLMAIGAGLRPQDALRPNFAVLIATTLKLIVYPAMVLCLAVIFGLTGPQISYLALCAAVPTAMNGYVLARQMGGDAELYAAIATVQTALAFVTIPLVLAVAGAVAICVGAALLMKLPLMGWLRWLGEHSLVVYLAFTIPMSAIRIVSMKLGFTDTSLLSVAVLVGSIIAPVVLYLIIQRVGFGRFLFERPSWAHIPGTPGSRTATPAPVPAE